MLTIAEIGSNYRDFDDILNYVHRLDADIIKLQYYDSFDLYGYGEKCKSCKLDLRQIDQVHNLCNELGRDLMISVFNHKHVGFISQSCDYLKVASSEITYIPLLEEMSKTDKEIFVSTGGATIDEIEEAIRIIGREKIILMGCNVQYPTNRSYPWYIKELAEKHSCRWGYSDHSAEIWAIRKIVKDLGGTAWEKHVKFNAIKDTADSAFAITVQEFNQQNNFYPLGHNPNKRINLNGKWVRP